MSHDTHCLPDFAMCDLKKDCSINLGHSWTVLAITFWPTPPKQLCIVVGNLHLSPRIQYNIHPHLNNKQSKSQDLSLTLFMDGFIAMMDGRMDNPRPYSFFITKFGRHPDRSNNKNTVMLRDNLYCLYGFTVIYKNTTMRASHTRTLKRFYSDITRPWPNVVIKRACCCTLASPAYLCTSRCP